jgi:phospholipid N-methyltransferase
MPRTVERPAGGAGIFLREFMRSPMRTGAILPSSRRLAAAMVEPVSCTGEPVVVELGPGTGAFTRVIRDRLAGRGRQLAVELNPLLAERVAGLFPDVEVVNGDACQLADLLSERGITSVDVVVSGLPWAAFSAELQRSIMASVGQVLSPHGAFTTFAYGMAAWTPAGRRMRALLRDQFDELVVGRTVSRNVPPAFVYYARRPRYAV